MTGRASLEADVDFDRPGLQSGTVRASHQRTRSAYGTVPVPIVVINGSSGPTVLLMAGTHGDELEGQVALRKLARNLDPESIRGRIIMLPSANLPAAQAGERTSPIDGANLNRCYPGSLADGPSGQIAHYISTVLLPMCTALHDLHSGGSSLEYMPLCSMWLTGDSDLDQRTRAAMLAFGAPVSLLWARLPDPRSIMAAANAARVINLSAELGGAGRVSPPALAMAELGVRRFLAHFGLIEAPTAPSPPSRELTLRDRSSYVYAATSGIFEPAAELGDEVAAGQCAGYVHPITAPLDVPERCFFRTSGIAICRRSLGLVEPGDLLFHLAEASAT